MSAVAPGIPAAPDGSFMALGAPPVPQSGRTALVMRLLLAVGLLIGMVQTLTEPVERPLHELLYGLQEGRVDTVTIARPEPGAQAHGSFEVTWTGDGLPGRARYDVSAASGDQQLGDDQQGRDQPGDDEGQLILDAAEVSPVPVDVTIRYNFLGTGTTWHVGALVGIAALLLLVAGPQPRLATRWAWFWLAWGAPLLWLAFVVLEPVPLWRREPIAARPRRLTGGWAFVLSLTLVPWTGSLLMSAVARVL